jgi:DnaD/phage-associated family protein
MPSLAGRFSGFPEGRLPTTPVPDGFFRDLLPQMDDPGELRAVLLAFYLLARRDPRQQYLRLEDLPGPTPPRGWEEALSRAVRRGVLLKVDVELPAGKEALYFLNTARGRASAQGVAAGDWRPSGDDRWPIEIPPERPNIYHLYESNLGPLTPMIAEALRDAEAEYPPEWVEDAIRIAVENNIRKWSYVGAILEDWRDRGRDAREDRGDTEKARRRYIQGKFADFLEPPRSPSAGEP